MPVGSVTRSQTVHSNSQLLKKLGFSFFFVKPVVEEYTPAQGEFIAAVQGTFNPEPKGVERGGALTYTFTPSHLRTKYVLSYFTVVLPSLAFNIPKTEAGAGTGEWNFELGFLTAIRISGLPYYSESISPEIFKLKSTEVEGESFTVSGRTKQISLVETITAVPGASIELELIPFVRVVNVIKESKFGKEPFVVISLEIQGIGESTSSTGVMVYEQEFSSKG